MFESRHFTVEPLADGVFAAVHKPGGWAVSNAGIVDTGDFTLIFDTFMTISAAKDLLEAANYLTPSPVKLVVNSHYHNDHMWGNQVFEDQALIVSSAETRSLITSRGREEVEWYSEHSASELKTLSAEFESESDSLKKNWIKTWVDYYEGLVETMPDLVVHLPDMTFKERLEIHGTGRSIELFTFSNAHTPHDAVMFIPSEDILFLSDLFFVKTHPFLPDGEPENLLRTLDNITSLDVDTLVPGHGPPGTNEDIKELIEYIEYCERTAANLLQEGKDEAAIGEQIIPGRFADWDLPNFFSANLRYYYRRLGSAERPV